MNTKTDMMNINIQFTTDDTTHGLWADAISLSSLGHLEITRAGLADAGGFWLAASGRVS
jgi:hypothetical protein